MALIQFDFQSEVLGVGCTLNAIVNQRAHKQNGPGHRSPVLYLLHGLSGDHSSWIRRSSIERYAEDYDLAIIMPAAQRSFYTNMHAGYRYFDFVADELPQLCQAFLPISDRRDQTFAAGLSMGGYGAVKLALSRPDRYAAAVSLSGALDLRKLEEDRDSMLPEWRNVFGPDTAYSNSENDLMHLASQLVKSQEPRPKLLQCCGTEDYLYESNLSFVEHCRSIRLAVAYEEDAGGHEWDYWDKKIQRALQWLPLTRLAKDND